MTAVLGALLIACVAGLIVAPLWGVPPGEAVVEPSAGDELWRREKAVALLAITEADFDRATGKLSNEDYRSLREDYEDRALRAIGELEKAGTPAVAAETGAVMDRFCSQCGSRFGEPDRYCSHCGMARG